MGNRLARLRRTSNKTSSNTRNYSTRVDSELEDRLMSLDPKSISSPPLKGNNTLARIVDVYDGDTVKALFFLNGLIDAPFKIGVRLAGIDCPELRTKNILEKKAGHVVRDFLRGVINNKIVILNIHNWDKYGSRIVGDVYPPDSSRTVSDLLLSMNFAKPYDGKTKKEDWTDEELKRIIDSNDLVHIG